MRREEGQMKFPKGLYINLENCRDLFVKQNFPSIQNPNEEIPKNESWRVFQILQHCFRAQVQKLKTCIFTREILNKD
jgi:hypothetical protein